MLALILFVLLQTQDASRVTIDRTLTMAEAVEDLSKASKTPVRLLDGVDSKLFPVRVTNAGLFEALDGICRGHGKARYFGAPRAAGEGQIEIRPGDWIEYPTFYVNEYKFIVSGIGAFTGATSMGSGRWNRVYVSLWGPPWLRVLDDFRAEAVWTLREARDAAGAEIRPLADDPNPPQFVDLAYTSKYHSGNAIQRAFRLKPFDLDKGLKVLKGSVEFSVSNSMDVEIPFEAGKSIESGAGTFLVETVSEPEKNRFGVFWRAKISLKPAKGVRSFRQAVDNQCRFTGSGFENIVSLFAYVQDEWFCEVTVRNPDPPKAVRLTARDSDRRVTLSFEFKDVKF